MAAGADGSQRFRYDWRHIIHMGSKVALFAAAVLSIDAQLSSQAPKPAIEFEVASVKPNKSGDGGMNINTSKGMWRASNISVEWLKVNTYEILPQQIVGAPGWTGSERFDIEGKFDPDESIPGPERSRQYQLRLQALLSTRFQLQMHRETKEWQSYVLVAGKRGPKLKPSEGDGGSMRSTNGHMECQGTTMENLAGNLALRLGRPVVDQTGLAGKFDFTLDYEEEGQATEGYAPSLVTAVQDQLGLKLESKSAPVEMLVVDHVERPSGN
jgi:uncharacterized protein (TIGR03435 family)